MKPLAAIAARLLAPREARNLANPLMDPRRYAGWMRVSNSGVAVTERTALGYSPIWCAVTMIALDLASIPTYVYRRLGTGKERDTSHPAHRLLRRTANDSLDMTSHAWRVMTFAQALLYNDAYSWIVRDTSGAPLELIPIAPYRIAPKVAGDTLYYEMTGPQSYGKKLDASDVFHLRGATMDGLCGMSVIDYCQTAIGRSIAADEHGAKFFRDNAVPAGILSHPGTMSEEVQDRLRNKWQETYGGNNGRFKVAVLEEAMTFTPMGIDPEKAQLLQSLEFGVREAARLFRCPPSKLGDTSRTSYSSLEQEQQSYYQQTLGPWFASFREEAYRKLLTEEEKDSESHTVEELQIAILRADAGTRQQFYRAGILDGWLSRDEVRAYENLNPIPDGKGAEFLVPLNMQPASAEGDTEDDTTEDETLPEDETEDIDEGTRAVRDDVLDRIIARLKQSHERKHHDAGLPAWKQRHTPVVQDMLRPLCLLYCQRHKLIQPQTLAEVIVEQWFLIGPRTRDELAQLLEGANAQTSNATAG